MHFLACVDCDEKCHCKDVTEDCNATNGHCASGCAQHFAGDTCQGTVVCTMSRMLCVHYESYWRNIYNDSEVVLFLFSSRFY